MLNRRLVSALILGTALGIAFLGSASAVAAPALRPDMVNSLEAMQQRLTQGENDAVARQARQAAERLVGGNAADRWARALFLQLAATAEARQGNDAGAADLFAAARDIRSVDLERRRQWLNQEARLRLRAGQRQQGVELLARWLDQVPGEADDFWLMARSLAALERWRPAADWVDRARQASSVSEPERRNLAASIYQRAGRDEDALDLLDAVLAEGRGEAATWRRATALAQRLGDPGRAAAIWDAGWRRGELKGDDALLQLVRLHVAGGTPARGAEYLATALEQERLPRDASHLRLLAEAWSAARDRERALTAWRDTAQRSGQVEDWQRLGELAYAWGRWQLVIEALDQAHAAGEMPPRQHLLQGIARLELGDRAEARQAFEAARQAGVPEAEAWLATLDDAASEPVASGGSG